MREQIAQILSDIRPEVDFAASDDFFADGLLDSADVMALVVRLSETFGVTIDGMDLLPENLQNLDAIEAFITSLRT